jgi:hypothetical protein
MSAGKQRAREPTRQGRRRKGSSPSPISSADNTELLRTLKEIFNELNNVEDVLIVCAKAYRATKTEQDEEVASVLRRCGADPLFTQLQRVSRVIEGLGGETSMTDDDRDDE